MAETGVRNRSGLRNACGLLCVPVRARDMKSALDRTVRAGALADLVELRLDLIGRPDVDRLVAASPVPVIATVRSRAEGGEGGYTIRETADLLLRALRAGADYVDVELGLPGDVRRTLLREAGPGRVILSRHVARGTPSGPDLNRLLDRMAGEGPAVAKIVCRACVPGDAFRVLSLVPRGRAAGVGVSAFCMGDGAAASRILSLRLGAALGYASLDPGDATADGQIPIQIMRRMLGPLHRRMRRGLSGRSHGPLPGAAIAAEAS